MLHIVPFFLHIYLKKGEGVKKLRKKNRNRIKVKATSLTALIVSVLILSALAGVQFIEEVSAIDYTDYTGTLDSADWALRIPDPWNGMLVVVCRGYSPTGIADIRTSIVWSTASVMLDQGFAIAGSTYGSGGFCIQKGVNSTYQLTMHVIDNYDVTGKVFLYGLSMGGAVALLLGEKYPDVYSGVLDLFGVKDLKDQHVRCSRWANLTDEELTAELTALTIPIPPFMFPSLQALRTFLATGVADFELETGGTPATQPKAYEDRSPTYHANIMIPVITVQGTSDVLVPFYESIMYQTAVANAGRSYLYRLYNVTGGQHVGPPVMAEVPARLDELVAWSDALTEGPYDWPMFGHDPQRSGYSESPAPTTNQTLWTNTIGAGSGSHPAVADDKVYVAAYDGNLYCFDAATGTQTWNFTTGDALLCNPAVAEGRVYVSSLDNNVYCLDAASGTKIWNYTTGGVPGSGPVVADGKLYVGADDGKLYCFRADDGQVEWNFTTGGSVLFAAVADGKVYFGSYDRNVYCLNAASGGLIWNFTIGDEVWGSPTVADDKVYVAAYDDNVYCLDAASGTKIWNYTTGDDVYSSPAVAYGKLYVGALDTNVYCLDSATGALIWNYSTGGSVYGSPTVADGKVYVGSHDRNVYCLDAATGDFIWSYETGGQVTGSPVVANGVAYAVSGDGVVYAFSIWVPIPEGLTIGVMLLLSTVAAIVGIRILRKQPKWKRR